MCGSLRLTYFAFNKVRVITIARIRGVEQGLIPGSCRRWNIFLLILLSFVSPAAQEMAQGGQKDRSAELLPYAKERAEQTYQQPECGCESATSPSACKRSVSRPLTSAFSPAKSCFLSPPGPLPEHLSAAGACSARTEWAKWKRCRADAWGGMRPVVNTPAASLLSKTELWVSILVKGSMPLYGSPPFLASFPRHPHPLPVSCSHP